MFLILQVYVLCAHSVERLLPPTLPAHAVALAASGGADEALTLSEHHITPVLWAAGEHDATLMHLAKLANAQQQSAASAAPPKEQLAVFAPPGAAKAASKARKSAPNCDLFVFFSRFFVTSNDTEN